MVLDDGSMAPLDYKFAHYREKIYETYKTQLYCYAWLIQRNYHRSVNCGYLVYTRSQNKLVEVPIQTSNVRAIEKAAQAIRKIIEQNIYPKPTKYKRRCVNCTYLNICIQ